jgi:hypothetical protein
MRFLVRYLEEGGSYEERVGNLGLGGVYFRGRYPPQGTAVEVRFRLKGRERELRVRGEIIRVAEGAEGVDFRVQFSRLDPQTKAAIAGALDVGTG